MDTKHGKSANMEEEDNNTRVRGAPALTNPLSTAMQSLIRFTHNQSGLPWWATLVVCTIGFRVALLPFVNIQLANTRKLMSTPAPKQFMELTSLVTRDLKLHRNDMQSQRNLLHQYRYGLGLIKRKNNVQLWKLFIVPAIQLPLFINYVVGVRGLITDPGTMAEMKRGGLGWFTDLTVIDPYYALPLTALTLTYLSIEQVWGGAMPWMRNGLHTLVLCSSPFVMSYIPNFVFLYWIPSASFGLAQTTFLRFYFQRRQPIAQGIAAVKNKV